MKVEIDIDKRYIFPLNIREVDFDECKLIISVDTARWIVIKNRNQYHFYSLLHTLTLREALNTFAGDYKDAQYVITQIEGKHFTDTIVVSCINPDKQVLHVYLTNGCNLRCPHCYMYAGNKSEKELSTSEIKAMLLSFKQCKGANVTFSGGEISLRKDVLEIVKYAHDIGLSVRLLTNGTLWTPQDVATISPYINSVQISVDGYDEDSNAKIRGEGNFSKSLNTLDTFIRYGNNTEIAITPFYDDQLQSHIEDYAIFAQQLAAKYAGKSFAIKFANRMIEGREIKMNDEKQKRYGELINQIYSLYYGQDISDYAFIAAFQENRIMDNCMYGELSIASNGDVYFCSRIPSTQAVTNIRDIPFSRIMELSVIAQKKSDISNLKPCCDCELMYICGGGCRIEYFHDFTQCRDIVSLDTNKVNPRYCNMAEKETYYRLMIRTNDKLFKI